MELQTQSVLDVPPETCEIKHILNIIVGYYIGWHAICWESYVTQTAAFSYIGVQASDAYRALYSYSPFQTDTEQYLYVAIIMYIKA